MGTGAGEPLNRDRTRACMMHVLFVAGIASACTLALVTPSSGATGAEHAQVGRADRGSRRQIRLWPGADAWRAAAPGTIRGVTIGPIENALHPERGYGSAAFERSLDEAKAMGATWVSITPFGRVWDLHPTGISLSFEQPFAENRRNVARAIAQAHARGLKVLLVPHLWVETGEWRGEIEPLGDEGWRAWARAYRAFLLAWTEVAEHSGAEMLAVGVELRSWVTTARAPSFVQIVREVRRTYRGLLTYAANWDDVEQTVILGELDVIGVNAFYPLADKPGADSKALMAGGRSVAERLRALADLWHKPVAFTEFGYTTRVDPAVKPWEWPDRLKGVQLSQSAQAEAYRALLSALIDEPRFAGFFMWRLYADPDDVSQEAEWGFSPRGKAAELVLRAAFAARWASEPERAFPPRCWRAEPRIAIYEPLSGRAY
jgi:hypothetical protein